MATTQLPQDFKEFLKLLSENQIEYLLIGGYAVSYYGYTRATADMDIWVKADLANAERIVCALKQFGFGVEQLSPELFLEKDRIVRMGVPPFRIELMSNIAGVEFSNCYKNAAVVLIDGVEVMIISLDDLKVNKRACGRHKDLDDLEHLG